MALVNQHRGSEPKGAFLAIEYLDVGVDLPNSGFANAVPQGS